MLNVRPCTFRARWRDNGFNNSYQACKETSSKRSVPTPILKQGTERVWGGLNNHNGTILLGKWGLGEKGPGELDVRHATYFHSGGPIRCRNDSTVSLDGTDMRGGNRRDMELAGLSKAVAAMDPCRE